MKRLLSLILSLALTLGLGIISATALASGGSPEFVYVGGLRMEEGAYLRSGASSISWSKPDEGYAHLKNGTLYLHNYTYTGAGYSAGTQNGALIYAKGSLRIVLSGSSSLTQTASAFGDGIVAVAGNISIEGAGALSVSVSATGIKTGAAYKTTISAGGAVDVKTSASAGPESPYGGCAIYPAPMLQSDMIVQVAREANDSLQTYTGGTFNTYDRVVIRHNCQSSTLQKIDGKTPNCTEDGKHSYYLCSCGKGYQDSSCTMSIKNIERWGNLPATGHTPSADWKSDGTNHWQLCTTCGAKLNSAAHSGGENACRYKAQCDVCEAFYGDFADHDWSKKWDYSDAKGHYHTCQTPGCDKLSSVTAHTPGAAATETTPQTCKDCGYVIKAAQGHTHKTKKIAEVKATCTTDGNREYYVCEGCGKWFQDAKATKEITREADVILTATGHSLEDSWLYDTYTHWQECACGEVGKKAAHTDEDGDLICDTCGREENTPGKQEPEATKPATNKTDKPSTDKTEKPDDTDSGNTGLVILVCVLAVLVLGAGAALVVILIKRKEKE